jgi:hypothetical protein
MWGWQGSQVNGVYGLILCDEDVRLRPARLYGDGSAAFGKPTPQSTDHDPASTTVSGLRHPLNGFENVRRQTQ